MKTFNEKDLITWSNHDKAIIGKLYYFGYWLESIQSKIETGIGDSLVSINKNSVIGTFKNECGYHYPCILTVDAVKDIEPEKKYRACKNIREFYIKPTDKNMNLQVHIYRRCTFKYLN